MKAAKAGSPDFVRGTSTELFLNYLGIQMDSRKAEGMKFKINISTPDNGETVRRRDEQRHPDDDRRLSGRAMPI